MKNTIQNTTKTSLAAAAAVLALIAVPLAQADNERNKSKLDRKPLKAEVSATFVEGYTVPDEYRTHFTDLPAIEDKNVVVRYHKGRAYYVNSEDWKIVQVVELDPTVKVSKEDAVYTKGYVIAEDARTRFIEVPNPDKKVSVRYYNNTAYYMDSSNRIVRTVRLSR